MDRIITARPLDRKVFAEFGDVIDKCGVPHYAINRGMTECYHALANVEAVGPNSRETISIGAGKPYNFPLRLWMVERHPFGSQAFIPLARQPFLVVVCSNGENGPGESQAFLT